MKAELRLELYAIAVGVQGESGVGTIGHDLEIVTETDLLRVPVQANILACKPDLAAFGVQTVWLLKLLPQFCILSKVTCRLFAAMLEESVVLR